LGITQKLVNSADTRRTESYPKISALIFCPVVVRQSDFSQIVSPPFTLTDILQQDDGPGPGRHRFRGLRGEQPGAGPGASSERNGKSAKWKM
jgi:hypothetical protein